VDGASVLCCRLACVHAQPYLVLSAAGIRSKPVICTVVLLPRRRGLAQRLKRKRLPKTPLIKQRLQRGWVNKELHLCGQERKAVTNRLSERMQTCGRYVGSLQPCPSTCSVHLTLSAAGILTNNSVVAWVNSKPFSCSYPILNVTFFWRRYRNVNELD